MKKDKKIITSIIIIAIIIMIILFIILSNFQTEDKNQRTDGFEDFDKLEFTIDIVDWPYDLENKSIYFQLKNVSDNTFNCTGPEIGKNLDIIIKAENGTTYRYAGPITFGLPFLVTLPPNEIVDGYQWFGFKIHTLYASGINYTWWQNSTTYECWFFQPGTYEIYGEYESRSGDYLNDVIVGIWYSNVVIFTIE
jgi:hypothetical protein